MRFNSYKTINSLFLTFIFVFLISTATIAKAETFTVTRSDDRNQTCNSGIDCSLREAVKAANSININNEINFSADLSLITLTSEIVISNHGTLAINGNGANILTVNGGDGTNRIFYIDHATVSISGMTLTGGNGASLVALTGEGGAIHVSGGLVRLDGLNVTGNSAAGGGGGVVFIGGGTHQISNSTFSNNSSYFCGGINNEFGRLIIVNSTITGNTASSNGGGGLCSFGPTTLRNVVITNNTSPTGGGIYQLLIPNSPEPNSFLNLHNTLIAGNNAPSGSSPEIQFVSGAITSEGGNLIGDSAGDSTNTEMSITYQQTDILDTNPMLGALQNNGGATPTHALLAGSPAINAGNNTDAPAVDQRGFPRIIGGTIDIGAFEFVPVKSSKRVRITF